MLSSVDPSQMKGRDVTVRQVLDEAAKKIVDGSLRDQPTTAAAVRTTLGQTYQALGLYPEAEPHLREALKLRQAALGPDSADVAAGLANLASLLQDKGDLAGADPLPGVLAIRRRVLVPIITTWRRC
jgi:tetratricopeptide (TPR) repeat protein